MAVQLAYPISPTPPCDHLSFFLINRLDSCYQLILEAHSSINMFSSIVFNLRTYYTKRKCTNSQAYFKTNNIKMQQLM